MCPSTPIIGETLQEPFLPTRPLAPFHTPNSTRACICLFRTACGATKHMCCMHLRARALVDRGEVYVYASTVHAMLQASHQPDHSTASETPQTSQQRQIAHNTQRAHAQITRTHCPNHMGNPEASQSHWLSRIARSTYSNLPSIAPRGGQASYCVKATSAGPDLRA